MSLAKRLRILYAALTQEWNQETCRRCHATWWVDRLAVPSGLNCQSCEDEEFDTWRRDYEARQQSKGAA